MYSILELKKRVKTHEDMSRMEPGYIVFVDNNRFKPGYDHVYLYIGDGYYNGERYEDMMIGIGEKGGRLQVEHYNEYINKFGKNVMIGMP